MTYQWEDIGEDGKQQSQSQEITGDQGLQRKQKDIWTSVMPINDIRIEVRPQQGNLCQTQSQRNHRVIFQQTLLQSYHQLRDMVQFQQYVIGSVKWYTLQLLWKKHQQRDLPGCSETMSGSSMDFQKTLYQTEEYSLWQE